MPTVHVESPEDGVAVVRLDRPARMNALSLELVGELKEALEVVGSSKQVRSIVLMGAGRAFSSGADVAQFEQVLGPTGLDAIAGVRRFNALALTLWDCPAPTVAAVNGPAIGGGAALAMLCDLRVASETAYLHINQVHRAIVPDMGATFLLPRLIGHGRAMRTMLAGESLSAELALQWGGVNEVVPTEHVVTRARELAAELASLPRPATAMTALTARAALREELASALEREATAQAVCAGTPEFDDALQAFRDR